MRKVKSSNRRLVADPRVGHEFMADYDSSLLKPEISLRIIASNSWRIRKWYIPVIPVALVNGADGIGTGWSTSVPNYNPRPRLFHIPRGSQEPRKESSGILGVQVAMAYGSQLDSPGRSSTCQRLSRTA